MALNFNVGLPLRILNISQHAIPGVAAFGSISERCTVFHEGCLQRERGVLDRIEPAPQQAEPLAHLHVLFRRPCNKGMPARLAAKAQAPMPVADKAKLSPAVGTTIL
jgi:hypothetical protein